MRAILLLLLVPSAMWLTQSVTLLAAGLPLRGRINPAGPPRHLRRTVRASMYVAFLAVLALYPMVVGRSPLAYYLGYFPLGSRPLEFVYGAGAIVLYLTLLHLAWLISGNVWFGRQRDRMPLSVRLVRVLLGALALAFVEELVFRSVVLADLMRSFDRHLPVAIAVGAAIFAGAHYVRPVTRHWTMFGQFGVSLLFSVAFACTNALWLPIGLHAGGMLVVRGVRPFTRYEGPAWLVGESLVPYAGVPGVAASLLLTLNVYRVFAR